MEVFIPPGGTALREMLTRDESEGHCFWFAASFVPQEEALPEPKIGKDGFIWRKSLKS